MKKSIKLSIIVPILNEADNIEVPNKVNFQNNEEKLQSF